MAKLPLDWATRRLSDIARRLTRKNSEAIDNVLTISAQKGLVSQEHYFNKRVASKDLSSYFLLNRGDFAYNKSYSNGYPFGAVKRLVEDERGVVSPLYICFELLNDCGVAADYLVQYFESGLFDRALGSVAQQGARNHGLLNVKPSEFFALEVPVPPLTEQRKIAAILSSVDEVIETTQGVIEQLQNLKRAMMQELLTRGLPGRHARFKQTEMGEIPDNWAIVDFGNLIANGPTNGIYKPASSIGSGTLLVGMTAVDTDDCINPIDWAKSRRATLTADERTYYSLQKNDLLIRRVYARIDGVGRAICVNEPPEPAVYESNMMRVRLDENVAVPAFYREYLDLDHVRARVEAASTLAAQASINNKTLRAIRVARPSVDEQIEVVCQLESMGRRLRTEREVLEGLYNLQSGLMSVLLTGELRTTPEKDVA